VPPDITARDAATSAAAGREATGDAATRTCEGVARSALAIRVNGEAHRVPAGCSVAALLERLALDRRRVAVAVNREVVPRSALATHTLATGDRVEILEAVGGG
jgi:sulfur carrier protein